RAAQTLEALSEDVASVAARGDLTRLPGVGRDLAARIEEYLRTGRIGQLETLRGGLPPSFLGLLEIRGLGPRTARLLWERVGVDSDEGLEAICRSGEILTVAGIRRKSCENILKGIELWKAGRARLPLTRARAIAAQLAAALRIHGGVERLEIAGSIRRLCETGKDVELPVTSTQPTPVIETLGPLPPVTQGLGPGDPPAPVRPP